MTAEIAILNREAVALAADSAVTFQSVHGQKIFTSANKIFTLSKYHPVGVMVYGNALFHETPWETVIKVYRKSLGDKQFPTLGAYARHFLTYLKNNRDFSSEDNQTSFARNMIKSYFDYIKEDIRKLVELATSPVNGKSKITTAQIPDIISTVIGKHHTSWTQAKKNPRVAAAAGPKFRLAYEPVITQCITKTFEKLPLSAMHKKQLKDIATLIFLNRPNGITAPGQSGLVIAGFGEKDIFPQCFNYTILGVAANQLVYYEEEHTDIGTKSDATIAPFAQDDVAKSFIEGVDPRYEKILRREFDKIIGDFPKLLLNSLGTSASVSKAGLKKIEEKLAELSKSKRTEYSTVLAQYRQTNYVNPMLQVVSMLPKDELANMAETLVNLTSFKRRVSMSAETVGGPVDVAVISKGDGFVWIKRKHYFTKDFNPSFVTNYFNG